MIFRTVALLSLAMGIISNSYTSSAIALDLHASPLSENTSQVRLKSNLSQRSPFVLSARDEQTEECRLRIQDCSDG